MDLIKEAALATEDENIIAAIPTMEIFYKRHRGKINKDEWEDFQQDIILYTLQVYKRFDPNKAAFTTFLYCSLIALLNNLITRYTGIKVTKKDFRDEDKITVNIVSLEEGGKYEFQNK